MKFKVIIKAKSRGAGCERRWGVPAVAESLGGTAQLILAEAAAATKTGLLPKNVSKRFVPTAAS